MDYQKLWQKTLNESEKVEYEFGVAPRFKKNNYRAFTVLTILFLIPTIAMPFFLILFIPWLVIVACAYVNFRFTVYALTDRRILVHKGWLSTKTTAIRYEKIVEISVIESFLNRKITQSGNVVIQTSGIGHDFTLFNVESPYEVKKMIDRLSRKA